MAGFRNNGSRVVLARKNMCADNQLLFMQYGLFRRSEGYQLELRSCTRGGGRTVAKTRRHEAQQEIHNPSVSLTLNFNC